MADSIDPIKLEYSPYTYARVAVMRSKLLVKSDYDKIMKMGFNEVLKYIEETQYKKEVDEFDISSGEYATIEAALNTNLMRTCKKLYKISSPGLQKLLAEYLYRYDVENLKNIIRLMFLDAPIDAKSGFRSKVKSLFFESINYPQELFSKLLLKESPQEVINTFSSLRSKKINTSSLFEIENALDRQWIERMQLVTQKIQGDDQSLIKSFLTNEINNLNIRTILRFSASNTANINEYLVRPSQKIKRLLGKKSIREIASELQKQGIIYLDKNIPDHELLEEIEIQLEFSHLRKNKILSHRDLLSPTYILAYFLKKDAEVRNLKILVKAKKLGLDEKFLQKTLVVPV